MPRSHDRRADEVRPFTMERGYTRNAAGSVLVRAGNTVVLCTACWRNEVPKWKEKEGGGWLTAEYDMLPGATSERRNRNRTSIDGRTQEIQRLIGRSLRSVVDLKLLGPNTIMVDCDVLQADGGTRTASITGAYVAVCDAVRKALKNRWISLNPIHEAVAAVSVGVVNGRVMLDLDYEEDSAAEVDMNIVMTSSHRFVEVQGTAERGTFAPVTLDRLVKTGTKGVKQLLEIQQKSLRRRLQ